MVPFAFAGAIEKDTRVKDRGPRCFSKQLRLSAAGAQGLSRVVGGGLRHIKKKAQTNLMLAKVMLLSVKLAKPRTLKAFAQEEDSGTFEGV